MAGLARLAGEVERDGLQFDGQRLGLRLLCGGAAVGGILHLLDDSLVGQGSLHCQLARQQEIAGRSRRPL